MKAYTAYSTTAIPKKVTDLNYQIAANRVLNRATKEFGTRRD